jgi:hypothetical protein
LPVKMINLASIWTVVYTHPSRYNWMIQFYLRAAGLTLSWIGSGRFIMSDNYSDEDYNAVMRRIVTDSRLSCLPHLCDSIVAGGQAGIRYFDSAVLIYSMVG